METTQALERLNMRRREKIGSVYGDEIVCAIPDYTSVAEENGFTIVGYKLEREAFADEDEYYNRLGSAGTFRRFRHSGDKRLLRQHAGGQKGRGKPGSCNAERSREHSADVQPGALFRDTCRRERRNEYYGILVHCSGGAFHSDPGSKIKPLKAEPG